MRSPRRHRLAGDAVCWVPRARRACARLAMDLLDCAQLWAGAPHCHPSSPTISPGRPGMGARFPLSKGCWSGVGRHRDRHVNKQC